MKRVLVVLLATVLALVGGLSVLAYTRSADQRALAGQQAVEVFVTTREVPAGTTARDALERGLLQSTLVAAKGVPDGALTQVSDDVAAHVATSAIAPGEIVLARRFGTQAGGETALVVPEGMVAVTVELSDRAKVSTFLQPGSRIAVYNTFTSRDGREGDFSPSGNIGLPGGDDEINATRVLLPNAEVLGVGSSTLSSTAAETDAEQQTEQAPTALVTLAVAPADAQRLVHGAQTGTLYAGLLGNGTEVPQGIVEDRQLFTIEGQPT